MRRHLWLCKGEAFAVSSSSQKVLTLHEETCDTSVDLEAIGKLQEPQSARHLPRQTYPKFQGPSFQGKTLTLS